MTRKQKGAGNIFSGIFNKTPAPGTEYTNPINENKPLSIEKIVEIFRSVFTLNKFVVAHYANRPTRSEDQMIDIFYNKHIKDANGNIITGEGLNDFKYYDDKANCVSLIIKIKNNAIELDLLKYEQPNECKISGTELLYLLYQVAKKLNYNIIIQLDASTKLLYTEWSIPITYCAIDLYYYNILLTGESWYNKYGYYSPDYAEEKIHNDALRHSPMTEYFIDQDNSGGSIIISEIIEFIKKYNNDVNITPQTTVTETIKLIDKIIRNNRDNKEIMCEASEIIKKFDIEEVLYTNLENGKHNNYAKNLVLDIKNPKIHALYDRLGKTIKLTTGGKTRKNKTRGGGSCMSSSCRNSDTVETVGSIGSIEPDDIDIDIDDTINPVSVFKDVFSSTKYIVVAHIDTNINLTDSASDIEIGIFYVKDVNDGFGNTVIGNTPETIKYYKGNDVCIKAIIKIEDNNIKLDLLKYVQPNKCKTPGTELLYLLYQVAKKLSYNIVIEMDASEKILYSDNRYAINNCSISLSLYSILLTGQSWYNKYGYYSPDYDEERKHNDIIRQLSMDDYFAGNNNKTDTINRIIEFVKKYNNDVNITPQTTVAETIKNIDKILNKHSKDKGIMCEASSVIDTFNIGKILYTNKENGKFNNYVNNLVLDIEDSDTIEIYDNLAKKLAQHTTGGKTRKNKNKNKKGRRKTKRT